MAKHNRVESPRLSVGEARTLLEGSCGEIPTEHIQGTGVGMREGHPAFVVTVSDLKAKSRFEAEFRHTRVGTLPLHVDISSFSETSDLQGFEADVNALVTRPSLWKRFVQFVFGFPAALLH